MYSTEYSKSPKSERLIFSKSICIIMSRWRWERNRRKGNRFLYSVTYFGLNNCEHLKFIYVNCRLRSEYESDPPSNEHCLSSSENKAWQKSRPVWDLNLWPLRYQCTHITVAWILFTNTQIVFITAKIAFTFSSQSTVQIYDFYIHIPWSDKPNWPRVSTTLLLISVIPCSSIHLVKNSGFWSGFSLSTLGALRFSSRYVKHVRPSSRLALVETLIRTGPASWAAGMEWKPFFSG